VLSQQEEKRGDQVDDDEVVRAFAKTGTRQGAGRRLEIVGDGLLLDGWWYLAMRVSSGSYLLRAEEPPSECSTIRELERELADQGLRELGEEHPHIVALTCTELSIGSAGCWSVWSTDPAAAKGAIEARIRRECDSSLRLGSQPYEREGGDRS
jgi:hypothetical protein